jgi:hypothetical protein
MPRIRELCSHPAAQLPPERDHIQVTRGCKVEGDTHEQHTSICASGVDGRGQGRAEKDSRNGD